MLATEICVQYLLIYKPYCNRITIHMIQLLYSVRSTLHV